MPSKTISFALRLAPSSLARLKAVAAEHERSAGWWAAQLIDEGLDRPQTRRSGAPEQQQPKAPVAIGRRSRRQVFGAPKVVDHVYAALEQALVEHGMTLADGRQIVQWTKVLPIFHAKRPGHRLDMDKDQLQRGIKALLEEGTICRDETVVWLVDAVPDPAETTWQAAAVAGSPAIAGLPPPAKHRGAPNYERFHRVLKHALSVHGVVDANGRRGVDFKKFRAAFFEARVREGETDNANAHKAAFSVTIKRLLADGVAERDGSLIRLLTPL